MAFERVNKYTKAENAPLTMNFRVGNGFLNRRASDALGGASRANLYYDPVSCCIALEPCEDGDFRLTRDKSSYSLQFSVAGLRRQFGITVTGRFPVEQRDGRLVINLTHPLDPMTEAQA